MLERALSKDMTRLSAYLQTWRLKLSHAKTVTAAFHIHNREAKDELKVKNNDKILPFCPVPTDLGVKLDRSLTTPAWCRSVHTRFIHSVPSDALRIVTECLRTTPTDNLPVLSGI